MAAADDDWFACPNCGFELPTTATFCRECGASDDVGWNSASEDGDYDYDDHHDDDHDDDDFDDDDFNYDEFTAREFESVRYGQPVHWIAWGLLLMGLFYFASLFF